LESRDSEGDPPLNPEATYGGQVSSCDKIGNLKKIVHLNSYKGQLGLKVFQFGTE
jgi:hypothetical protein